MPAWDSGGFLGGAEEAPSPTLPNFDGVTARAMFDLPAQPTLPGVAPAPTEESLFADVPPPSLENPMPVAAVPITPTSPTSSSIPAVQEPRRRRRGVVGIFVNVAIAAALVMGLVVVGSAYLNDGKVSLDSLSAENLKSTFAPSAPFVAIDVTNGLYDTRAGRAIFYVHGEVANRSEAGAKLVVRAEIVENGKVVRASESFVGDEPATPEELHQVDTADALEALQRKVEKRARPVPPGGLASFVVAFTEYPPDLKGFSVRVSARAVPMASAVTR